MDSSLLLLPPHLLERIENILRGHITLPKELRDGLHTAVESSRAATVETTEGATKTQETTGHGPETDLEEEVDSTEEEEEARPAVIEIEQVESLARWAASSNGTKAIRRAKLDPGDYSLIALLAGTQVYYPPAKVALLKTAIHPDKPNPYLPAHLSPGAAPLTGYKALNKQISTILNVLFSIVGAGGAVYVASVTGAGYSREVGVILGVIAALVVGVAEMILLWIFVWRIKEGRRRGIEQWKGSSAAGVKEDSDVKQIMASEGEMEGDEARPTLEPVDDVVEGVLDEKPAGETRKPPSNVRLRRRAIGVPSINE